MSLKEREYMQPDYKGGKKKGEGIPLKNRILFFLWRVRRAILGGRVGENPEEEDRADSE